MRLADVTESLTEMACHYYLLCHLFARENDVCESSFETGFYLCLLFLFSGTICECVCVFISAACQTDLNCICV